jgi:hypothetical protein
MSQTYADYPDYYQERDRQERFGGVLVVGIAILAGILVLAGLIYATGTPARHRAAVIAGGCEPSLFIKALPCITQAMVISKYQGIVTPAGRQLSADMAAYQASEQHNLVAAEAALTAEVATERALGSDLAAAMFTPQNKARTLSLITGAEMIGANVPSAAITLTPQATVIADALARANQALATLTAEQAHASSLTQMRSFNTRVATANTAVQTEVNLVLKTLRMPLSWNQ